MKSFVIIILVFLTIDTSAQIDSMAKKNLIDSIISKYHLRIEDVFVCQESMTLSEAELHTYYDFDNSVKFDLKEAYSENLNSTLQSFKVINCVDSSFYLSKFTVFRFSEILVNEKHGVGYFKLYLNRNFNDYNQINVIYDFYYNDLLGLWVLKNLFSG